MAVYLTIDMAVKLSSVKTKSIVCQHT